MAKVSMKRVRESLIAQLEAKGADLDHFVDLVEKYCELHNSCAKLTRDINKRGVVYLEPNTRGDKIWKNNASVKDRNAVIKQMLDILNKLELDTNNVPGPEDDEM